MELYTWILYAENNGTVSQLEDLSAFQSVSTESCNSRYILLSGLIHAIPQYCV